VFAAGSRVESTFRFNSYRAGYRYLLCDSQRFRLGAGGCVKVRDAAIELRDAASSSEKTDLGFVPLLSLSAAWVVRPGIRLLAELDGLAAPQGRAEDLLLAVEAQINDMVSAYAGYRLLEGGADNDEVYTFSLFQYAVAGVSVRL